MGGKEWVDGSVTSSVYMAGREESVPEMRTSSF